MLKFIRFGQHRIQQSGAGILAFITNHSYLDNPTFRGMRQQLMDTFTDIYLLDLHGNALKKESAPDGSVDSNVFDIQPGVAIAIFVKEPGKSGQARVPPRRLVRSAQGQVRNPIRNRHFLHCLGTLAAVIAQLPVQAVGLRTSRRVRNAGIR